jgi:hypothetical protein
MSVGSTNYAFQMPSQGQDPWANQFYTMVNAIDAKLLANEPPDGTTLKWGLVTDGHYIEAVDLQPGTALGYNGTHDRKNGSFKNLALEVVGAIPPAGANDFDGRAVFKDLPWFCRDGAGNDYTPLTRPTLVVGPIDQAEYTTLAAAVAAAPASGGCTILVMPGTYTLAAEVVVPGRTSIIGLGRGVNVDCSGSAENVAFRITDKSEITIANMTITGDAATAGVKITATDDVSVFDIMIEGITFIDGLKAVELSTAFVHKRVTIRNCRFSGVATGSSSAIDVSSKIQDFRLESCWFETWGEVAGKRVVQIVGGATSRQAHIRDLTFETNNGVGGVAEDDLYIENVDDLFVSGITSRDGGGDGLTIKDSTRVIVSDCMLQNPAGDGVVLDGVVEGSLSNVAVASAGVDGWKTTGGCSKIRFDNCSDDSAGANGFNLATSGYLTFSNCTSRGSTVNDLNVAADVQHSRFDMTLSKAAAGAFHDSNGREVSISVPLEGWLLTEGAPAFEEIGVTNYVGWAFSNAAKETISGAWVVPADIMNDSDISFDVLFVGSNAAVVAGDVADFEMEMLTTLAGTTLVTDAPVVKVIDGTGVGTQHQVEKASLAVFTQAAWGVAGRPTMVRLSRTVVGGGQQYGGDVHIVGLVARIMVTGIEVVS